MNSILATFILLLSLAPHGDLHEQIAQLDKQVKSQPKLLSLRLRRGELLRLHGEFIRALKDYQFVQASDPQHITVHLLKGRLFLAMKRHKASAKELAIFLATNPKSVEGLRFSAQNEIARNDSNKAVQFYQRLCSQRRGGRPGDVLACSRAMVQRDKGSHAKSIVFLESQLALRGSVFVIEIEALELEKQAKLFDAALKRILRLARGAKRQDLWSVRLAELYKSSVEPKLELFAWKQARKELLQLPRHVRRRPSVVALHKKIEQEIARHNARVGK